MVPGFRIISDLGSFNGVVASIDRFLCDRREHIKHKLEIFLKEVTGKDTNKHHGVFPLGFVGKVFRVYIRRHENGHLLE